MKKNLVVIMFLTLLFGCSKSEINNSEKRNENWCWFVDKENGEGKWVPIGDKTELPDGDYTLFFSNGNIRQAGKLKDKKEFDTIFQYDIHEKLICKYLMLPDSTLKLIRSDGKYKSYFSNCVISGEGEFKNNKQIGTQIEYFKNGKVKRKSSVNSDTLKVIIYYESGTPKSNYFTVKGLMEGLKKSWHSNGKVKGLYQYKHGLQENLSIWYYETGQVATKCNFKNGIEDGFCISYFENSLIKQEGNFKNGEEEGIVLNYFENGQLDSKVNYSHGHRNGDVWFYYPNGKLKMSAKLDMGVTIFYKSYNENGKLIEELKNGNKIDYRN